MFTEEPIPRADSPEPEKAPPKTKEPRSNTPLGRASKPQAQRFRCQECATEFSSEGALQQHQQDKNHRFLCPECSEGFFSLAALIQHQQAKGHQGKSVTKCNICQQILKTEEVVRHIQDTQHSSFSSGPPSMLPPPLYTASATPNSATFICPKCAKKFNAKNTLLEHQHEKNHLFDCPKCPQLFVTLGEQQTHQKKMKHEVADFICPVCDQGFKSKISLNQHQKATEHVDLTAV